MSTYVIGDVHSCWASLKRLVKKLPSEAKILFIGDLVNRGPETLKCIRFAMKMGDQCRMLIGNHELHLLGVAAGVRKLAGKDTLAPIFEAKDCQEILDWVRFSPLALEKKECLCVHAAVHPDWTKEDTLLNARKVESVLQSDDWKDHMHYLFGKEQWRPNLPRETELQAICNVLTRTRYLNPDGTMEFKSKLGPRDTDPNLIPWFEYPDRKTADVKIVFGHWSTLGPVDYPNVYPTDTGCLWGGQLSALKLSKKMKYTRVECPLYLSPKEA